MLSASAWEHVDRETDRELAAQIAYYCAFTALTQLDDPSVEQWTRTQPWNSLP